MTPPAESRPSERGTAAVVTGDRGPEPGEHRTPGSRREWISRNGTWLAVGVLVMGFLLPLRGLLVNQGPPMEEGFMLVFPERFLEGDLPNRDFLHLYGPGSVWALAGVFEVFGVSLWSERAVALLQQAGVVFGVFALALPWGRRIALACGLVSLVIIVPPIGLTALAWVGGVALGLWGLKAALRARELEAAHSSAGRYALAAGLLGGLALLYRPDLVVAIGLGGAAAVWGLDRRLQWRVGAGAAIGVSPYLLHFATAGFSEAFRGMVLDPVVYLRGGRRLPIPPSFDELDGFLQRAGDLRALTWLPAIPSPLQLSAWLVLLVGSIVALVWLGGRTVRRRPGSLSGRVILTVGLFSLGMLPQAIQRPDSTHIAWVSCVPIAFMPVVIAELLRSRRPDLDARRRGYLAGGSVLLALFLLVPNFTFRSYTDFSLQTFGIHRKAFAIENAGRTFYYGRRDVADALNPLLEEVERRSQPGDRLFVGTADLRKTPYSDAFLYYLLPDLDPATYFIEMDPGVANAEDSRLADDVASADLLILSHVWDDWDEPNDSRDFGPDEPNEVKRRDFCLVDTFGGLYELWERCAQA